MLSCVSASRLPATLPGSLPARRCSHRASSQAQPTPRPDPRRRAAVTVAAAAATASARPATASELPGQLANPTAVLHTADGASTVYVLGISHVSKESCREIEQLIRLTRPDVVLVE